MKERILAVTQSKKKETSDSTPFPFWPIFLTYQLKNISAHNQYYTPI